MYKQRVLWSDGGKEYAKKWWNEGCDGCPVIVLARSVHSGLGDQIGILESLQMGRP